MNTVQLSGLKFFNGVDICKLTSPTFAYYYSSQTGTALPALSTMVCRATREGIDIVPWPKGKKEGTGIFIRRIYILRSYEGLKNFDKKGTIVFEELPAAGRPT